ncbi:hypothetical protein CEP49_03345 [Mergibacter septicus]|uniref:autotransporter outer membrane beta-barrel domain-containing protein n=1 Tax=Mergibacter septicus TaxID=221402 RepID=UPI001179897C|nr:autotransporter outer membrane beta-barrel domain-containing protein [Mergibacter septicus]AWX13656.1 hypothetical protein CEP49_03345 [Mergibacter septicus]
MKTLSYSKLSLALFSAILITVGSPVNAAAASAPPAAMVSKPKPTPDQLKDLQKQIYQLFLQTQQSTQLVHQFFEFHNQILDILGKTLPENDYKTKYVQYDKAIDEILKKYSVPDNQKQALKEQLLYDNLVNNPLKSPPDPLIKSLYDEIDKIKDKPNNEKLANLKKKLEETVKKANESIEKQVKLATNLKKEEDKFDLDKQPLSLDTVLKLVQQEKAVSVTYNLTVTTLELLKNLQDNILNTNQKVFDYTRQVGDGVWAVLTHQRLSHTDKKNKLTLANNKGDLTSASFGYQKERNGVRLGVLANVGRGETKAPQNLKFTHTLVQGGAYIGASNANVFVEGGIIAGVDKVNATTAPKTAETKEKFNVKTLGVILNGGYKFTLNDKLSVTPAISYQYQELSAVKAKFAELDVKTQRLAVNQIGVSVTVDYKPLPDLSILAKAGVDALKRNTQVSLPDLQVLPLEQVNIIHQTKNKDVRTHFSLEASKQFGKATIGGEVGYNHYLKSKLSGVNVGLNLGYRF